MSERFKTMSAVILFLVREQNGKVEILLQKRKNTGYADGYYDLSVSGHVENNESMKEAVLREAKEEIGVEIDKNNLEFVCLIHKNSNGNIYYNGYFLAKKWEGKEKINEPDKNEELKWFDINELPNNIVDDRIMAIENYKNGIKYSEFGWDVH